MPAVPEPLQPWVPWVLERHPDLGCPQVAGTRICAWPGRLTLGLDDRGGSFTLEVLVDREMDLLLPGDPAHWPRDVEADGGAAFMRRAGESPAVFLRRGSHRLSGSFRWSRLPESLPVPPSINQSLSSWANRASMPSCPSSQSRPGPPNSTVYGADATSHPDRKHKQDIVHQETMYGKGIMRQ